jgi:two-component system sensor histidine kinase KdpD
MEHRQPIGVGATAGRVVPPSRVRRASRPTPERRRQPAGSAPVLYVPIATANRVIGVLRVERSGARERFTTEQGQLLTTFANQAALAIERTLLDEEATRAAVLARSDELKSALLSAVSHDLRTPLASIKASVTSLLQDDIDWSPADQRELLIAINEETDRLTRVVGNLLDLSRVEAGVLKPHLEWNEVEELVRETATRARSLVGSREIVTSVETGLPPVRFDYVEIGQVLMNLIENAARYAPDGTPITISAEAIPRGVEVSVADRGPGIPMGQEERIFDRFYRIAQRPGASGAGIGLSVCRGIVEAHGGRIWAAPREGGGAIFRFTLPVEPAGQPRRMETA